MKKTLRKNITELPYSLHDMYVTGFRLDGNDLVINFRDGFERIDGQSARVNGHIEISGIDWDFCWAYVLDFSGNEGVFKGQKMSFTAFAAQFDNMNFEIVDETYGYNCSKFAGYLRKGRHIKECFLEIYHFGDMCYVEE